MMKKKCYILIGLPGTGKSHWTKNILNDTYEVLSTDDLVEEFANQYSMTYDMVFSCLGLDGFEKTYKKNLQNAIENKKNLVIDRTNLTLKSRKRITSALPKFYEINYILFPYDENLQKEMVKKRELSGKIISQETIATMINTYTPPSYQEKVDNIYVIKIPYKWETIELLKKD